MKTIYLILIAFLGIITSCTTTDTDDNHQNKILGKWKLIEWCGSESSGCTWQIIEDGYYFHFYEDNTLESDLYFCNSTYIIDNNLEFNLLISFFCETNHIQHYFKIEFLGNYLILRRDCEEECIGKFKRIQDN
jgi:hypothetical protein